MLIKLLQSLPEFRGKNRLGKFLLKNFIATERDKVMTGSKGTRFRVPNFAEPIGFSILVNGAHEKETSDFILNYIKPNGTFVDIGANIGAITVAVSAVRKDLTVLCVEASPKVFRYLEENVKLNNLVNCKLVNKAISDADGQKVSFFSPADQHGKGSLSPVFTDKAEEVETITVDTLLSSQLTKPVDFIKIDIEGFEYFAFKSGEKVFGRPDAPVILFEFIDWAESNARGLTPGDSQRLIMKYGYFIYLFKDGKPTGEPLTEAITAPGLFMLFATKTKI
ncbi:MAG: FkbM family methyltransferase [Chitinophagaceae bacterium]